WMAGRHIWHDYIQSLGERTHPTVRYIQAQFTDENSFHTVRGGIDALRAIVGHLPWPDVEAILQQASGRGQFLHADTLLWLQCRDHDRLLVIDLSTFQTTAVEQLADPQSVESARVMLQQEIAHLRTRSAFADLSLDLGALDISFSEGLGRVLAAVARRDKEVAKLIQAGSYAASFLDFASDAQVLAPQRALKVTLVGYSDYGLSSLTVDVQQRQVLDQCAAIYRRPPVREAWDAAYAAIEQTMQSTAVRSLSPQGQSFVDALLQADASDRQTATPICYTELMTDFANVNDAVDPAILEDLGLPAGLSLRTAHAQLIDRALAADAVTPLVVLSGHPGIGKTTAILNFLKAHADEGFLFLYVSPRTQVNDDVVAAFTAEEVHAQVPDVLALTTTSDLIRTNRGRPTVAYHSKHRRDAFVLDGVHFIPADGDEMALHGHRQSLQRTRADTLRPSNGQQAGVLASMGAALGAVLRHNLARQVVATVSIQSLKQTTRGTTLSHLEHIFAAARNARDGTMNAAAMRTLAQERRHLFVMIDEITGDVGGPAFYHAVDALLRKDGLLCSEHGFNTKVIVADASLTSAEVIQQHLNPRTPERATVYVRRASTSLQPLTAEPITLRGQSGILINANAYPARTLTFTANVLLDLIQAEDADRRTLAQVHNQLLTVLEQDVLRLLADPATDQIIVYLQDKHRLSELVGRIGAGRAQQGQTWEEGTDYLLIHADVTPTQKRLISQQKQRVNVV
ncbi:MAG: hypothetical protein CYG59_26885, partial [Chloroflexi bacterium]